MAIRSRDDLRARAFAAGIPDYMIDGLERYLFDCIEPGDFLFAVLANELVEAYGRADENNTRAMRAYASFLYNDMPTGSWGSREIVEKWLAQRCATCGRFNDHAEDCPVGIAHAASDQADLDGDAERAER